MHQKEGKKVARPRTVSPPPKECIELGKDLLKWISEDTDEERLLLGQWWSIKHGIPKKVWKQMKLQPEFTPYYEIAQQYMALKCINGTISDGFAHRYIRMYDTELCDNENEKLQFQSELKKAENNALGSYIVQTVNYATHKNNSSPQV